MLRRQPLGIGRGRVLQRPARVGLLPAAQVGQPDEGVVGTSLAAAATGALGTQAAFGLRHRPGL